MKKEDRAKGLAGSDFSVIGVGIQGVGVC